MNNLKYLLFIIFLLSLPFFVFASNLAEDLKGKILLQVEQHGEAWYVSPENSKRYFLGRPDDAFNVMREQGIGISNSDLDKIPVSLDYLSGKDSNNDGLPDAFKIALGLDVNKADTDGDGFDDFTEIKHGYDPLGPGKINHDLDFAKSQAGRILLQVERNGEAWYVNPENNKRYFLGRPNDAFSIMRNLGLGISNENLETIAVYEASDKHLQSYSWHFKENDYSLSYSFDKQVFSDYSNHEKLLYYLENEKPDDLREAYYQLFLEIKENDNDTLAVLDKLKDKARNHGYSGDTKAEFILSFIQYIPYDHEKAKESQAQANFPFETLYLNKGVCTDTSFLAILWLNELDYGTAILDFPDSNHAALGIKCPIEYSLSESGFCYVETTNYFPFGIVPRSLQMGEAKLEGDLISDPFSADSLGEMEVRLISEGSSYYKIVDNYQEVEKLANILNDINNYKEMLETDLDNRLEIINKHNDLVAEYNQRLKLFYHHN